MYIIAIKVTNMCIAEINVTEYYMSYDNNIECLFFPWQRHKTVYFYVSPRKKNINLDGNARNVTIFSLAMVHILRYMLI